MLTKLELVLTSCAGFTLVGPLSIKKLPNVGKNMQPALTYTIFATLLG